MDTSPVTVQGAFVPDACASCLQPLDDATERLFCSDWCQDVAKHVRYIRKASADGRINNPDVGRAVAVKLRLLQVPGYSSRSRRIPPRLRAQIVERDAGRCRTCGGPGTDVDHIAGNSADPSNLQLLCSDCHKAKTNMALFGVASFTPPTLDPHPEPAPTDDPAEADDAVEADTDELDPRMAEVMDRLAAETPLRACDHNDWDLWRRALRTERRERLLTRAEELSIDRTILRGMTCAAIVELLEEEEADLAPEDPSTEDYDGGYGPDSYFHRATQRDD